MLQEQSLKVFETVDRIFPEVGEVVRGMSDDQIRAAQASLTPRLQRIVGVMPQVQSIVLIGRDGRPLAATHRTAMQGGADFAGSTYFAAQADADLGTYVSDVRISTTQVPGRRRVRPITPAAVGRRIVPRRHRGRGAAALLR